MALAQKIVAKATRRSLPALERENALLRVLLNETLHWYLETPSVDAVSNGLAFEQDRVSRLTDMVQTRGSGELPLEIGALDENVTIVMTDR